MDPCCLLGAGGVMVWVMFSWHNLELTVPTEHYLNTKAHLSIVADCIHCIPVSPQCCFQQNNVPSKKTQIISNWFLKNKEFTILSLGFSLIEQEIHIMDVKPTDLQQLCDAVSSTWTRIWVECFQHLAESVP